MPKSNTNTRIKPSKPLKNSIKRTTNKPAVTLKTRKKVSKKTPLLLRPLKRLRSRGFVKLPSKKQTKKVKKFTTTKWFRPVTFVLVFGIIGCCFLVFTKAATDTASCSGPCKSIAGAANAADKYWIMGSDGGVFSINVPFYGSVPGTGTKLSNAVGMVSTPTQAGYYIYTTTGAVYAFGNASYKGGSPANVSNVVGFALRPQGDGYWMVGSDGGVFAYGGAPFKGSSGAIDPAKPAGGSNSFVPSKPIVGLAPTNSGNGYWMVGSDGGVFAFGDAAFHGSLGGKTLNAPVIAIEPSISGNGYWMVGSDGGVFAFGDAKFFGGMAGTRLAGPIVAVDKTPTGNGYWMVGSDGGVFAFGDAKYAGRVTSTPPPPPPAPPKPPAPRPSTPRPNSSNSSSGSSRNGSSNGSTRNRGSSPSGGRNRTAPSPQKPLTTEERCNRSPICRREVRDEKANSTPRDDCVSSPHLSPCGHRRATNPFQTSLVFFNPPQATNRRNNGDSFRR